MKQFLIRRLAPWLGVVLLALGGATPTARAQAVDWARTVSQNPTTASFDQITVDAQGNSYLCGSFSDSLILGAFTLYAPDSTQRKASDLFVAKLDPSGACLWATRAGGQGLGGGGSNMGYDVATSITLDPSGNVFVTGVFDSYSIHFGSISLYNAGPHTDLFIAKLNGATGQWLWARRAGGIGYEGGTSVKSSPSGDVYVLGGFDSDTLRAGGFVLPRGRHNGVIVAKLSGTNGQWLWASRGSATTPTSLALDGYEHAYITGVSYDTAQFGTSILPVYKARINSSTYITNNQCFVARLSTATGAWQWATQGGDSNRQSGGAEGTAIQVDAQGRITVAGAIRGCPVVTIGGTTLLNHSAPQASNNLLKTDVFVAQLDSAGQWLSASAIGGGGYERVRSIAPEPGGTYCLGGTFDGPGFQVGTSWLQSSNISPYLVRTDATGTWLDGSVLGTGSTAYVTGLATDLLGRRYVAGLFQAPTFQLGAVALSGVPQGNTGFVARLGAGPLAVPTAALPTPAGLGVWPNPTTGTVRISGPAPGQTVWLVDIQGRRVAAASMPAEGPLVLPLPAGLAVGLYVVRVPGTGLTRRLVVE